MDSLLEVLRGVTLDPGEQAAFSADPQGYLAQHGYEGVPDEDVAEAFGLVADTLPADVASANPPPMDALDASTGEDAFGQGVDDLGVEPEADPMGDLAFGEGSAGHAEFDSTADPDMDAAAGFDADFGADTGTGFEADQSQDDFDQDDFGGSGLDDANLEPEAFGDNTEVYDDFVDDDFVRHVGDDLSHHGHGDDIDDIGSF